MNNYERKVRDFHLAFDIGVDMPITSDLLAFRKKLIGEEVEELYAEIDKARAEIAAGGSITRETLAAMMKGPNYHPPKLDDLIDVIPVGEDGDARDAA